MASFGQLRVRTFAIKLLATFGGLTLAMAGFLTIGATNLAQAQTYKVIYNFAGGLDGSEPTSGLTRDAGGKLYGTTFQENQGTGTLYRLVPKSGGWLLNPLYMFTGYADGGIPYSRLIFGPDGILYGTTGYGGVPGPCPPPWGGRPGCGTVFNLRPTPTRPTSALSPWIENVIFDFDGSTGGSNPYGGDIKFDQAGNLYGATYNGGTGCGNGCGIIYKLTPSGGSWTETIVHTFTEGGDGLHPWSGVIIDKDGNLYGTTVYGGAYNFGTIYELSPSGSGWTETILYSFTGGADGGNPYADLIFDPSGNIYGATTFGGSGGGGTAFSLTPSQGGWSFNTIYSFSGPAGKFSNGPFASLTMDKAGNLYGTTHADGPYFAGGAFKLTPGSGGWTYTSLHDFTNGLDGGFPRSNLIFDASGNLYGTASTGGSNNYGVIFEITP